VLRETDPQIMIWELPLPGGQAAVHRAASGRRLPGRRALPRPLMRMHCGGNAIKPDLRVRRELRRLGFVVPGGEHAILVVAKAAAADLGVDLLVLDQLLWWAEPRQ
jgi:hypothetical protein